MFDVKRAEFARIENLHENLTPLRKLDLENGVSIKTFNLFGKLDMENAKTWTAKGVLATSVAPTYVANCLHRYCCLHRKQASVPSVT